MKAAFPGTDPEESERGEAKMYPVLSFAVTGFLGTNSPPDFDFALMRSSGACLCTDITPVSVFTCTKSPSLLSPLLFFLNPGACVLPWGETHPGPPQAKPRPRGVCPARACGRGFSQGEELQAGRLPSPVVLHLVEPPDGRAPGAGRGPPRNRPRTPAPTAAPAEVSGGARLAPPRRRRPREAGRAGSHRRRGPCRALRPAPRGARRLPGAPPPPRPRGRRGRPRRPPSPVPPTIQCKMQRNL